MNFFNGFLNSGTAEQQDKRRLGALLIAVTAALLAVALIILMVASVVTAVKNKRADGEEDDTPSDSNTPPTNYTTTTFADTQLYSGNLLLLDETHAYSGSASLVRPEPAKRAQADNKNLYRADYSDISLTQEALDAFNTMILAFHEANKNDSGYTAGKLYLDSNIAPKSTTLSASTKAAVASGTVLILSDQALDSTENEATIYDTTANTGKGVYKWIYQNAYKYGFIRASSAEGEENVFRYVGTVHAQYMNEKGKTVAEYIEILKAKTAHNPLKITVKNASGDNEVYHVYYLTVGSESMFVPTNAAAYTVSGDNVGGYIVTVNTAALKTK